MDKKNLKQKETLIGKFPLIPKSKGREIKRRKIHVPKT